MSWDEFDAMYGQPVCCWGVEHEKRQPWHCQDCGGDRPGPVRGICWACYQARWRMRNKLRAAMAELASLLPGEAA